VPVVWRTTKTTLKVRVAAFLAVSLTVTLLAFAALVVRQERATLLAAATGHVNQLSDVVVRSTRFAMLNNRPDYVHSIIQDVARQEGIDRVRIFSKEGVIIDSTVAAEVGRRVDRKAEGCSQCHQSERPLERIPQAERARVFTGPDGERRLASMEVIRNEPSCVDGGCHAKDQTVLGVLDIVYPLGEMDRRLWQSGVAIVGASLGFVLVASFLLSVFIHRAIYRPLGDLKAGASRLAAGRLDEAIPVRNRDDEFGELAASFNAMTRSLGDLTHNLEQKVAERTEALRAAQAEAARGEKLASVGLLAAGIAHELNNPLTGVLTFSTLMRKKFPAGSAEAEDLDLVIRETKRCAAIIRRLLDFAREKTPEKKYADLNRLIEETVRIVERPAHLANIDIRLELDPQLPPVWVDADLIRQVIMNILVNAQHAIEKKGVIRIGSRVIADSIEIRIEDNGCGIQPEHLPRIFDPFFTTKGVGKGTGLGLSVSHGIVAAHGGRIEVASQVGTGTTFRVVLPLEKALCEAAS
jgi:two-component system NtrC family sensor kinase